MSIIQSKEIPLLKTTKFIVDNRGKSVPTTNIGIKLIATNCIDNDNLYPIYKNVRYISQETYNNWFRSHPEPGDIILTLKGSQNGAVCLVPNPIDFVIAQDMVSLRVDEEVIDRLFLFAALRSEDIQVQIKSLDVSGVIPHFKKSDFDKLMLPYPDRETQKYIGRIHYNLCYKIDLLHRQNKTLEQLAETIFRQKFIEEANENWETTCFSEHTEALRGLSYKGEGLTDGIIGVPMHNLNSIFEGGGYKFEGIKFYKGEYKERHIAKPGDLIIANTEQGHKLLLIGYPAIIPNHFGNVGIFSHHIYKLSLLPKTYLTKQFFYYLIKTPKVREQITGATNGSTVNMLAIDGLQLPEFQFPPEELVVQFSELVKNIWDKKEKNFNQIHSLQKMRETLLPKLMSGEVSVKI